MSDQKNSKERPYQLLGSRLRKMRQNSQESPDEVSGAVEIDVDTLKRFEYGAELPSEDILMLLINHFGLCDDEAVSLWELAGYDQFDGLCEEHARQARDEPRMTKQPVVVLALDARVVYSNGAEVVADKNGVVLSFSQFTDTNQGPVAVARVGMSYDQADCVLKTLQQALLRGKYAAGPKGLPSPRTSTSTDKKSKRRENDV